MSLHNTINSGTMTDSDDERYEQELIKRREEAETRGAIMGGAESKKRDKGGREKATGGRTEEASGGRETTERGSRETDEGRGGMMETKRGRQCFPSGSRLTGGSRTGAEKKLVE